MHSSISLYNDFYIKRKNDPGILNSVLKYFIRSFSRPTPFGFFSKIAIGEFKDYTEIILDNSSKKRSAMIWIFLLICMKI
ncbi:lantibiotic dehydratase [Chryseobacterium sp. 3008163]|uniref:lantibiotic dehydratase n=1 Tax=Chryseobacterium sp. 3008163 TaxID=2478663 RepID=UPI000F0BF073|nr:hypothetical protein EAG08_19625 [Chryseobacterium sp. 3008163]